MRKYVWLDFETTGLIEGGNYPLVLEVAGVITNEKYEEIADPFHSLVTPDNNFLNYMNSYVLHMHRANGLIDDLLEDRFKRMLAAEHPGDTNYVPKHTVHVDQSLSQWVKDNDAEGAILAGASVGSLDRPILMRYFPETDGALHYRNLDVSSFMVFMQDHFPGVYGKWKANDVDEPTHRALADIRRSVSQMRFYAEALGAEGVTY